MIKEPVDRCAYPSVVFDKDIDVGNEDCFGGYKP